MPRSRVSFTSTATAISDREHFKRDIAAIVAANREQPDASTSTAAVVAPEAATATPLSDPPVDNSQEPELKRRVLDANPDLKRLFSQLVVKERRLTEADFWENRQHLLEEERFVAGGQRKGRVATIQGPQLQTTAAGETRISVTPEIIREIFEVYPVVQRAYNENVPPLSESDFWSRYFQSKLFAQTRSTTRNAGDTVKADPIFDRYLGEEDDELEPKRLQVHEIHRLLDLEATASDHVEVRTSANGLTPADWQSGRRDDARWLATIVPAAHAPIQRAIRAIIGCGCGRWAEQASTPRVRRSVSRLLSPDRDRGLAGPEQPRARQAGRQRSSPTGRERLERSERAFLRGAVRRYSF